MKEYIEKAVAIERARNELDLINKSHWSADEIVDFLKRLPAADVRPVVLCKDCKFWECPTTPTHNKHFCDCWESGTYDVDFCSFGEKRDGGADK